MRSKLLALVLGCGLVAAVMTPAMAGEYQTNASSDQGTQQTAQAQQSPETTTQQ